MKSNKKVLSLFFITASLISCSNSSSSDNTYFKVTFKVENRNYDVTIVKTSDEIIFPETPEKEGYTFVGWYDENDNQFTAGSELTNDIIVKAKFKAINYNINYNVNGGTRDNTIPDTYTIEDNVTLGEANKEGYTFDGWYNGEEKVTSIDKGNTGEINLEAKYNIINHEIKYENTYGLVNENNPTSYNIESGTINFYDLPDRAGFTFAGWSYNGSESSTKELEVDDLEGSITLKAMWNEVASLLPFTYVEDDSNHIKITGIKDIYATEIVVPDYVYEISLGAFRNCKSVEKLTIPFTGNRSNGEYYSLGYIFGGLTFIQNDMIPTSLREVTVTGGYSNNERLRTNTFYNCMYLTNIVIGDGVSYIEECIFYDCFALTSLTLPFVGAAKKTLNDYCLYPFTYVFAQSTTNGDKTYTPLQPQFLFYDGDYLGVDQDYHFRYLPITLTDVTITGGAIVPYAFNWCENLKKITLGEGITAIGSYAFRSCANMEEIVFPSTLEWIGHNPFWIFKHYEPSPFVKKLTSEIQDEDGFIYLNNVLYQYNGTDTDIEIKEGTIGIADDAFNGNTTIKSVKFPSTMKQVGLYNTYNQYSAFYNCSSLETVELNEGLETIGNAAFYGCSSLNFTSFPSSIKHIGKDAFNGTYFENNLADGEHYIGKVFYKYSGKMPANTSFEIKEGTGEIGPKALAGYDNLVGVNIPTSVTCIGDEAFSGSKNLTNVVLPNGLMELGEMAFNGCTSLNSIVLPPKVKVLSSKTFEGSNAILIFDENTELELLTDQCLDGLSSECNIFIPNTIKCITHYGLNNGSRLFLPALNNPIFPYTFEYFGGDIYFLGTPAEASNLEKIKNSLCYYSEGEPSSTPSFEYDARYWHYEPSGKPTIWGKESDAYFTVIEHTESYWSHNNADKLFDNSNEDRMWIGNPNYDVENGIYFIVEASREIMVRNYIITVEYSHYRESRKYLPKSWVLYASNDCENWTTLDSVENSGFYGFSSTTDVVYIDYTFNLNDNSTSYKYYKFVFHSISEDFDDIDNDLIINEIKFDYVRD